MELFSSLATWIFWAWYAAGLFIMGTTLIVHLRAIKSRDAAPWIVVGAAFCGVFGSVVGGIQAGPHPLATAAHGVAEIRAFWVLGITLGIVASFLYLWGMRKKGDGQ